MNKLSSAGAVSDDDSGENAKHRHDRSPERETPHERRRILIAGNVDTCPDLEYATGFRTVDPVLLLATERGRFLVVPQMEYGRAASTTHQVTVLTPETLGLKGRARGRMGDWAIRLLRNQGIGAVEVAGFFPFGIARRLEKAGIRVRLARQALFPERAVKRVDEIRKIRESQQAAVIAMRTAIAMIADSEIDYSGELRQRGRRVTSEWVREVVTRSLVAQNCLCREIIVAGGRQAADPHEQGHGPLRAGETIVLDIFPQHLGHGYWGDLTRTVVRGSAPPALRQVYHAVRAAQAAALDKVRPGVRCSTIHAAAVREFRKRGLETQVVNGVPAGFIHGTGHGVGLSVHEAPSLGSSPERLKAGNVITVEPGLYYPNLGGVRIEDTVIVSPHGWRYLVPCEKRFEV